MHIFFSLMFLLSGCFDNYGGDGTATIENSEEYEEVKTTSTSEGVTTASIAGSATTMQVINLQQSQGAALSGQLQIRPGTLAGDTKITIEEGTSLAESIANSSAGTGDTKALGKAMVVRPSLTLDPKLPLILSLPLEGSSLSNSSSDFTNLVVAYQGINYSDNQKIVLGIIPRTEFKIKDGSVTFESQYFGSFQILETTRTITSITKLKTSEPIKTIIEVKNGPSVSAANICKNSIAFGPDGVEVVGTAICDIEECTSDGGSNCKVAGDFVAVAKASLNPTLIKSGSVIAGVTGTFGGGYSTCTANASNCILPAYVSGSQPLKAIDFDAISSNIANIRSSTTIGGLSGSLSDCSSNASVGCVANSSYQSYDPTNLTSGNIRSGIIVGGVTGSYPSASTPLLGNTGAADLDTATFNAKIKSSTSFEWFDSAGNHYSGNGDNDIVANNIANTIDIFGTTGNLSNTAPNEWDVRAGVVVNGITGKLPTECRNGSNMSVYDTGELFSITAVNPAADYITAPGSSFSSGDTVRFTGGSPPGGVTLHTTTYYVKSPSGSSFQISMTSGGSALDLTSTGNSLNIYRSNDGSISTWDTIDDYNNGGAPLQMGTNNPWASSYNFCGGVGTAPDQTTWVDVTSTPCTSTSAQCRYKDKITNLEWSEPASNWDYWGDAVTYCKTLTWDGVTGWRLPTQKETMNAYIHNMVSIANNYFMTGSHYNNDMWSSTTVSYSTALAWAINYAIGETSATGKNSFKYFQCVR